MRFRMLGIALAALALSSCTPRGQEPFTAIYGVGSRRLVVATGSPGELGLLRVMAEEFSRANDARVAWRKAGTGESLQLLRDRKADAIMVHAPAAEKQAVKDGWAARRTLVGSNEFYLVGPAADPARVASAGSVVEAYRRIAGCSAKFFSRADNSGTNIKELAIWKKARIVPAGDWYVCSRGFMMATLLRADAEGGYFMTDSSTWVAGKARVANLRLLYKGDPFIVNVYHALCQPPGATPAADLAAKFVDFLASPKAQTILREYGKDRYGEGLYNDAHDAQPYAE